ncbi:RNA-directed DNA polymerase [Petrocella sp. FN5]|uniref:RNA-directed DNA polymerase n=1 Tax=Petrocella sp. FN5 TaxID=3032002 RepID=UPI0023DCACF4|nr:RNA-directed DNA polymerase [Petrocella sp. FN5]MDF1617306.1 RNA-directed DNA polymerase [Petrocella sp. FN5]
MFGLDSKFVKKMNHNKAISRILHDVNSDFIISPHYNAVYKYASDELWKILKSQLGSGSYNPLLPITTEVPKKSGLTRPGAILNPIDRLLYQLLIDIVAEKIEAGIDRKRVFSNEFDICEIEPEKMFVPVSKKYKELRAKLAEHCKAIYYDFALVTDIACYYERIYQHVLVNILRSTTIEPELVSIIEKVLSAHTSKDSHGIVQGIYPSDILGNYYLTAFDSYLNSKDIEFLRFVDDYWMFFTTEREATKALIDICNYVRKEGLYLNEHKTKILSTDDLHYEETEIDRLFDSAKEELANIELDSFGYNFDPFDIDEFDGEIEDEALKELFQRRTDSENLSDKIDKFCLPRLAILQSDIAVEEAIEGLIKSPHLTSVYMRYLRAMISEDNNIIERLEDLFNRNKLNYDWQVMWLLGLFYSVDNISDKLPMQAYAIMEDNNRSEVIRAMCALVASKHGNGPVRRLIRNRYSSEPSSYVREAILYSTKHFPSADDKNACVKAWEGHSEMNKLIVKAMKSEASD